MYNIAFSDFGAKGVKGKTCPAGQVPVRHKGKWKCVEGASPCAEGETLKRWKAKGKWKQACIPATVNPDTLLEGQLQTLSVQTPQLSPEEQAAMDSAAGGLPTWAWGVIGGGAALVVLGGAFVVMKKRKAKAGA